MPQMGPLNWILLFIMFTLVFLMFNSLNYFSLMYNPKKSTSVSEKKTISFKW